MDHPDLTNLSLDVARNALSAGAFDISEKMARNALTIEANNIDWLNILATTCAVTKRSEEAVLYFRKIVEINPADGNQLSNLGNALCDIQLHSEAIEILHKAIAIAPQNSYAHHAMARSYHALGDAEKAILSAELALNLEPNDTVYRLLRASLRTWLDDWDGARADLALLRGRRIPLQQLVEIANIYLQMNQFDDSRKTFSAVLRVDAEYIDAILGLGLLEERVNSLQAAQVCVDNVIDLYKKQGITQSKWHPALSQLNARLAFRAKDFRKAADILANLINHPIADPLLLSHLYFELGTSLDQLGDFDSAWHAFSQAHATRKHHLSVGHKGVAGSDLLEILENPVHVISSPGSPSKSDNFRDPVFIVGFPRSGTTLLEQILDSQEGLKSFDEQPFLQQLLVQLRNHGLAYPQQLDLIDNSLRSMLRKNYFDYVSTVAPDLGTRRPVDKNPLNLVRLPFAQSFLPNSKVIVAIRHPCDVVLSCHMQSFRTPALQTSFSSLETTAELYAKVMSCWQSFREKLTLPTYVHRYEDLVTEPVKTTKELANFLELPWNDSWIEANGHAQNKGTIRTPSYAQVMEPINQKAKGRWLRYKNYFSDCTLQTLAPWIAEFGYPKL